MATSNLRFRIIGEDDASAAFLKVAAASKLLNSTFSDLGTNALGLTKLMGGAGLIPVLAAATGVTLELGTALGAAAGAGGIFGLSVFGVVKDMVKQQAAMKVTSTALAKLVPGTALYTAKLKELHAQQSAFNLTFGPAAKGYNDMTDAFSKFKAQTSNVTTSVLGKGMELLASVLPRLVPISNAAGRAVGGLIDHLTAWTKTPAFQGVLDWFQHSGPRAITAFGLSVGHILTGLGGIFANFVGPGDHAAKTLETLTKRFSVWGNSKGVSDSVNKFLHYISGNSGAISSTFSSLAQAAPKIASAFGGLGSLNLKAISMLLNLIAGMPQGAFDVVVKGLFAIAAATKLISIGAGIAALVKGAAALGGAALGGGVGKAAGALGVQKVFVVNMAEGGLGGGKGILGDAGKAGGPLAAASVSDVAAAVVGAAVAAGIVGLSVDAMIQESKSGRGALAGGLTPAQWAHYNATGQVLSVQQLNALSPKNVTATADRVQALTTNLGKASAAVELVGHSSQRVFPDATGKVGDLSAKLAAVKGDHASAAFDLIGHSAATNSAKAASQIDILTGKIRGIPDRTVKFNVDTTQAMMNLRVMQQQVDQLHGKTIIIRTTGGHVPGDPGSGSGGGASGGGASGNSGVTVNINGGYVDQTTIKNLRAALLEHQRVALAGGPLFT